MATLRLVPLSGSPIEITNDTVSIGRDPGSDIVLNDGSVSRRHARIEKRGDVWAVVDQASANGTFLDSQRVADVGLRHGHELRFGAVSFLLEIPDQAQDMAVTVSGAEEEETVIGDIAPAPAALPRPPRLPPPPASASPPQPPAPSLPPPPPSAAPGGLPPVPGPVGSPPAAGQPGQTKTLFWAAGGCCGCLTLLVLVAAVAAWFFYYPSVEKPAAAVLGRQPLLIKTLELVEKQPAEDGIEVTLVMAVSGLGLRAVADQSEIDLAVDLETLTPEGKRLEVLCVEDFLREARAFPSRNDEFRLTSNLTFPSDSPPGKYRVRLTVRDLVDRARDTEEIEIQLP